MLDQNHKNQNEWGWTGSVMAHRGGDGILFEDLVLQGGGWKAPVMALFTRGVIIKECRVGRDDLEQTVDSITC